MTRVLAAIGVGLLIAFALMPYIRRSREESVPTLISTAQVTFTPLPTYTPRPTVVPTEIPTSTPEPTATSTETPTPVCLPDGVLIVGNVPIRAPGYGSGCW